MAKGIGGGEITNLSIFGPIWPRKTAQKGFLDIFSGSTNLWRLLGESGHSNIPTGELEALFWSKSQNLCQIDKFCYFWSLFTQNGCIKGPFEYIFRHIQGFL